MWVCLWRVEWVEGKRCCVLLKNLFDDGISVIINNLMYPQERKREGEMKVNDVKKHTHKDNNNNNKSTSKRK